MAATARTALLRRVATTVPAPHGQLLGPAVPASSMLLGTRAFNTRPEFVVSESRLTQFLQAEITHFAHAKRIGSIGLQELLSARTPRRAARYIATEIPRRFARRIRQIEEISEWHTVPQLVELHGLYSQSFREVRTTCERTLPAFGSVLGSLSTDLQTPADCELFSQTVQALKGRQSPVLSLLGASMQELNRMDPERYNAVFWNKWLDEFLNSRICTEMLTAQYLTVMDQFKKGQGKINGIIDAACDPTVVCRIACDNAKRLCKHHTGLEPVINVEACTASDFRFSYIPTYLHYVMLELLKNSCRATANIAGCQEGMAKRPINIVICADPSHVAIRISDLGGGIPFTVGDRVWDYLYSSGSKTGETTALSGYGLGLPLARLYAQYLGGSCQLVSMPDYGVDAYLFLELIVAPAADDCEDSDNEGTQAAFLA